MATFNPEIRKKEYIGSARPEMDLEQHSGNTKIGYTDEGEVYLKQKRGVREPNLAAGLTLNLLSVNSPAVDYQDHTVIFENLGDYETLEESASREEIQKSEYLKAAASKLIVGDIDVSYNMLVKDSCIAPIDYDCAGNQISTAPNTLISNYEASHEEILNYELQEEQLREKAGELARELEIEQLEEAFGEFDILESSNEARQILENVEKAQNW